MSRWLAQEAGYGACVVPLRDLIEHTDTGGDADEDCVCGPAWSTVECEGGVIRWVLTHHSLDGREHHE